MSSLNYLSRVSFYASDLTNKLNNSIRILYLELYPIRYSHAFWIKRSKYINSNRKEDGPNFSLKVISNLFSIFDPSTSIGFPLNWFRATLGVLIIPLAFWVTSNRYSLLVSRVLNLLHQEFSTLLGANMKAGHTVLFVTFFVYIVFNNLLGLVPYIFTARSHLVITLALSLPIWVGIMLYGWFNHTKHMLAHLVPLGTPGPLMPLMVLIETIRNVIRPGTLAVRLAANMIAGHLLLVLLGNQGPMVSSSILTILLITQILLLVLETAVAAIQSYVFAVLATLYSSEVI